MYPTYQGNTAALSALSRPLIIMIMSILNAEFILHFNLEATL